MDQMIFSFLEVSHICGHEVFPSCLCEGEGDVVGVKAPLGGVAQVIFHGVQVVEVGVQVRVHQDRGVEEDGRRTRRSRKGGRRGQRQTLIMDGMRCREDTWTTWANEVWHIISKTDD